MHQFPTSVFIKKPIVFNLSRFLNSEFLKNVSSLQLFKKKKQNYYNSIIPEPISKIQNLPFAIKEPDTADGLVKLSYEVLIL